MADNHDVYVGLPQTEEEQALLDQRFRLQQIETYRQTVAAQVVTMLSKDADESSAVALAKKAKRIADALVTEVFPDAD